MIMLKKNEVYLLAQLVDQREAEAEKDAVTSKDASRFRRVLRDKLQQLFRAMEEEGERFIGVVVDEWDGLSGELRFVARNEIEKSERLRTLEHRAIVSERVAGVRDQRLDNLATRVARLEMRDLQPVTQYEGKDANEDSWGDLARSEASDDE
jgi:hypothetical protein